MHNVDEFLKAEKLMRHKQEVAVREQLSRDRNIAEMTGWRLVRFFLVVLAWSAIVGIIIWMGLAL